MPLRRALLEHENSFDNIAAQVLWITMLRLMGDLSEATYKPCTLSSSKCKPIVMEQLSLTLKQAIQIKRVQNTTLPRMNLISKTLKRNSKVPQELLNDTVDLVYYQQFLLTPSNQLSKIQFIIGHGILRVELRDEIYAQICKQLTNNPNSLSFAKGWLLLILCLGCFSPSVRLVNYLPCFVANGPPAQAKYAMALLQRTLRNGTRQQPPALLEIEAACNSQLMQLPIHLMNDTTVLIKVDAAVTAQEVLRQLYRKIGLQDTFGFSLDINDNDTTHTVGSGRQHVFDAISLCEQRINTLWRLVLRKQLFAPCYDPNVDQLATQLIYKQILHGIQYGDYACDSDDNFALLCALVYFAEHGVDLEAQLLRNLLSVYLPCSFSSSEANITLWERRVTQAFANTLSTRSYCSKEHAKQDICLFAQQNWIKHFSRHFAVVECTVGNYQGAGDIALLAINSQGLFCMNKEERVLCRIAFSELSSATTIGDTGDMVKLSRNADNSITFRSTESADIVELINRMLATGCNNARSLNYSSRSREVISAMNYKDTSISAVLQRARKKAHGKVTWSTLGTSVAVREVTDGKLENDRNSWNLQGQTALNEGSVVKSGPAQFHTLQNYAQSYFRERRSSIEMDLWRHSAEPLRAPLLQQTQANGEGFQNALVMSHHMQKYMGDIPRDRTPANTDLVFRPAIEYEMLRDELYCQLMRQLTDNFNKHSVERGWELMYLATGVVFPKGGVAKELNTFLETHTHPLASECLTRLKYITERGPRRRPPCLLEVVTIQERCMEIKHEIHFPNGSVEPFEIQSFTRACDLAATIQTYFSLQSVTGCAVFIVMDSKLHAIAAEEYIYDAIAVNMQHNQLHTLKRTAERLQNQCTYQLHFKKQLWLDCVSKVDKVADELLHYPQAVLNYLSGYFNVSEELAVKLSSLVYVSVYGNTTSALVKVHNILQQLLPTDVLTQKQHHDWKSLLKSEIQKHQGNAVDELAAKQEFLAVLSEQRNFGSTFFAVKQNCDDDLPKLLLLAVNKDGISILDLETKHTLQSFSYATITSWNMENSVFELDINCKSGWSKLQLQTGQAQELTDLLNNYMEHFILQQ